MSILANIIEFLPLPLLIVNREHKIVYQNKAIEEHLDYMDNLTGQYCYKVFKNNSEKCSVSLSQCPVRAVIETGESITLIHYFNKKPIQIDAFSTDGYACLLFKDLKPYPESLSREKVFHTGRMAAIGSMLIYITHNLNTALNVLSTYMTIIKRKTEKGENIQNYIEKTEQALRYISTLTRTVLDFGRPTKTTLKTSLSQALDDTLTLLKTAFTERRINVYKYLKPYKVPMLPRQEILTILFLILQNSIEAMTSGGKIFIHLSGNTLRIRDTGPGIPKERIKEIFNTFSESSKFGYGLGLYICKLIMNRLNGFLEINSDENKGTEVILRFAGSFLRENLWEDTTQTLSLSN
jgi:nitrogen-specific signal transduction histidine kinase